MFKKILTNVINISLIVINILLISFFNILNISNLIKILLISLNIILYIAYKTFDILKINKLSRLFYVIFIMYSFSLLIYTILYKLNIIQVLSSVTKLKEYILSTKHLGVLVYILLQLLQVVFLPIPASVICIVGSLIYGPLLGGIYCCIGVLLGSYISFVMGKLFGYKLVSWIVGKSNAEKYTQILNNRGGFFLVIAFLLPMFPDDILCLIAGITNMSFKTFFWIALITRPVGVICMSYFGSGQIIPFNGWGLYAWLGILFIAIIIIFLTYKYQDKMQNFVLNKLFKKRPKKQD